MNKEDQLSRLRGEVLGCRACELCDKITNKVFGVGSANAGLVIVGEAPGAEEDATGVPFCGDSGKLLTKYLNAIGLLRDDIFICNVLKCRPPANRDPALEEVERCSRYLFKQIEIIDPKVILAVGKFPAQTLLATETPISKLRQKKYEFGNAILIPTFHPSYLLRQASAKLDAWEDWKVVRSLLR